MCENNSKESNLTEIRRICWVIVNDNKMRSARVHSSLDTQEEFDYMQKKVKKQ